MSGATLDVDERFDTAPGRLSRWATACIVWYQRATEGRLSPCRFTPSCSAYALESFETHSSGRASWLTVRRLVRCRPFGPSGFDPVPSPADADRQHLHDACDHGATGSTTDLIKDY